MARVKFYSELLGRDVIKRFYGYDEAIAFARAHKGIVIA